MAHESDRGVNQDLMAQLEAVQQRYTAMRAGVSGLQQRMSELECVVQSEDRLVKATVGATGQLVRLEFDPGVYRRHSPEDLALLITDTVAQAVTQARDQVAGLIGEFMPADSGLMQYLQSSDLGDLMRSSDQLMQTGESGRG